MKEQSIKKWYCAAYPEDDLGLRLRDIPLSMAYEALKSGEDFYTAIGVGDSLIRQRLFQKISEIYSVSVDIVYDMYYEPAGQLRLEKGGLHNGHYLKRKLSGFTGI